MGKRSGVPHRDDELEALSPEALAAEIARCRRRLSIASSAKTAKQWRKRIHWLESAEARAAGNQVAGACAPALKPGRCPSC
jgi:hypothetical protein